MRLFCTSVLVAILISQFSLADVCSNMSVQAAVSKKNNKFLLSSSMIPSDNQNIQTLSKNITQDARCDREKAILIHDWVARNISYNDSVLTEGEGLSLSNDPLKVLERRKGTCVGISALGVSLLRAAGVPAKLTRGFANASSINLAQLKREYEEWDRRASLVAGAHTWLKVYLNHSWQNMDITFDLTPDGREVDQTYLLPQQDFFQRTHLEIYDYDEF